MSTQANKTSQPIKLNARIQKLVDNPDGKVKAIASVSIGGAFAIHGIKVIDSEKGKFVAMPNEKWTDADGTTKYKDIFHAITADARQQLIDTVITAYEQKLKEDETQGEAQTDPELPDTEQSM